MRTPLLLLLALLLAASLVACSSGDDDDDDTGNDAPAATEQSDSSDNGDNATSDDSEGNGATNDSTDNTSGENDIDFGDGLVVVTIGEDRYEFDLNSGFNVCREVFGGLQFGGSNDDGVKVDGWIPPANWDTFDDNRYDPPGLEVEVPATNNQWTADAADAEFRGIPAGMSQVDSFQIDGLHASGAATFYDTFAIGDTEPVQGTFEISCTE